MRGEVGTRCPVIERLTNTQIGTNPPGGVPLPLWTTIAALPAMYDNSNAFNEYLNRRRVAKIAASLGLHMQSTNTVNPQELYYLVILPLTCRGKESAYMLPRQLYLICLTITLGIRR